MTKQTRYLVGILVFIALLTPISRRAHAAILTWDGSASGFWTNAANWNLNLRPTNGDSLHFPEGAARLLATNVGVSGVATNFRALTLSGSNYFLFSPPLSITNGLTNSAGIDTTNTMTARITARSNQTWEVGFKSTLILRSNVNFTNVTLTAATSGVLEMNGTVSANIGGTLNKTNNGRLKINSTGAVAQVNVQDGTLEVNGTLTGALTIHSGATLQGTGSVPAFVSSGIVSPSGFGAHALKVPSGTAVFNNGSQFLVSLDGTGTNHTQLRVASPPTLTGAGLIVLPGYNPLLGDSFVIITNTGASAFSTTFNGRPEGATQTVNNVQFRISYVGGSGNDVTLTVVGFNASVTTAIWDGEGANNLWLNTTNWSNNIAPGGGHNLLFPPGAAQSTNVNDFPAGTTFNAITFLSNRFDFSGHPLVLLGGIAASQPGNFVSVRANVTFSGAQTVRVDNVGASLRLGTLTNAMTLDGPLAFEGDGVATVNARITGSGGIDVGTTVNLFGTNTFAGVAHVRAQHSLRVGHPQALGAIGLGNDTFVEENGDLGVETTNSVAESLRLAGHITAPNDFHWSGPVTFLGSNASALILNHTGTFSGPVNGTNIRFSLLVPGTLIFSGTNSVTGSINLGDGGHDTNFTLIVNGPSPGLSIAPLQGVLSGTGEVANVTSVFAGVVQPGFNRAGTLTCSNLSLRPASRFVVDVDGSSSTRLRVRGNVDLASFTLGTSLLINFAAPPPYGVPLVIIDNAGPAPVAGRFFGWPEGATNAVNGVTLRISYTGGDGNDVTLTRELLLTGTTRVWDGGGANDNWNTPENWVGDVLPVEGDSLDFPSTALRRTNINNLAAFTAFNTISFSGPAASGGYQISGSPLQLLGGIIATNAISRQMFNGLTLLAPQIFEVTAGGLAISGNITNNSHTLTVRNDSTTSVVVMSGAIHGAGGLRKIGFNTVNLVGANTYGGATDVEEGELVVLAGGTLGSPDGAATVASGATLNLFPTVTALVAEPLQIAGRLLVSAATNFWTGPITLTGDTVFDIGAPNQLIVSNTISGAHGFLKTGSGALLLVSNNTYSGETTLTNGTLFVGGIQSNSPVIISGADTRLLGSGTLGPLTLLDGRISASASLADSTAVLRAGDLFAGSSSRFEFRLNGITAGTQYDRLSIAGAVNLSGAALLITNGFTPAPGTSFIIIENDGADAVSGSFFGLPEGSIITTNGIQFRISYVGGTGNDVTLTRPYSATGITRTWDGGGVGNLWSTAANWVGDVAPQQGDNIEFPPNVPKESVIFDAGTNAAFNRIVFGSNFFLANSPGHSLRLFAGLRVANPGGPVTIAVPIALESNQTWSVDSPEGSLRVEAPIELGLATIVHSGFGNLALAGAISGAGGLTGNSSARLTLLGTNTFTGSVIINSGEVLLGSALGLGSDFGGTLVGTAGTLSLSLAPGVAIDEPLTLAGRVSSAASGTNFWIGPVVLVGAQANFSFSNSYWLSLDGPVSGSSVQQIGNPGTLVFNGANFMAGPIRITSGRALVNSSMPSVAITLTNAAKLGGTGVVGFVEGTDCTGCEILPGPPGAPGLLRASRLFLFGTSRLLAEINGPAAGVQYDQLEVDGEVVLFGTRLDLVTSFIPAVSQEFMVLKNNSGDSIIGEFSELPQGAWLTNNGVTFQISYVGGDGNDVTLTRVISAAPSMIQPLVMSNGVPVLIGQGVPHAPYVLEVTPHLVPPIPWQPIQTNNSDGAGAYQFLDFGGTNFPMRFYRVLSP
jgi:autotransporter-associated beta strand protein